MGNGHSNLYSLGLMRVFASLMVVIYHFDNMVTVKYGYSPYGDTFGLGTIGVNYFFVLSGFLLYQIHRKEWECLDMRCIMQRKEWPAYFLCIGSHSLPLFCSVNFLAHLKFRSEWTGFMNLPLLSRREKGCSASLGRLTWIYCITLYFVSLYCFQYGQVERLCLLGFYLW